MGSNLLPTAQECSALLTRPLLHMLVILQLSFTPPPPLHTGCLCSSICTSALPRFPHYIAEVSEHSIMLNQIGLCFDTEKWFLRNNTIVFV